MQMAMQLRFFYNYESLEVQFKTLGTHYVY